MASEAIGGTPLVVYVDQHRKVIGGAAAPVYITNLENGGASDVDDLTTATGSSTEMLRVASTGGLEYRTQAEVLGDIGALPLAGGTMSGTLAMDDNLITKPVIKDYGETRHPAGDTGGGTVTINLENGNVWSGTVSTATTTFAFSNWPASGLAGSVTMIITNGGSQTVYWPAAMKWPNGTEPELTASGTDIITVVSDDAGTTIYGFLAGPDMS